MSNTIHRSEGTTPAERYLKALCEHSFLRLWSYASVYRNQTAGGNNSQGKEVCDLLVVFENHIIIFSDKYISFPDSGDLDLDWARWVRRAVLESGEQLYGAERWIKIIPIGCSLIGNVNSHFLSICPIWQPQSFTVLLLLMGHQNDVSEN